MRRFVEIFLRSPFAVSAVLLLAGCADMPGGPGASLSAATGAYESATTGTRPRVDEDGYYVTLQMDISGYRGRQLPVQVWSGTTLLGERLATPTYEDSTWKSFPVFVPHSRFAQLSETLNATAYVLSPENSRSYIQKTDFSIDNPRPHQAWEFLGYEEDVPLNGGQRGFRVRAKLNVFKHEGEDITVIALLRDANREDFKSGEGGPIRQTLFTSRSPYAHTVWPNVLLEVPYAWLDRLGLGRTVVLTPAVRFADGSVRAGNIHVRFYNGGSLSALREQIGEETRKIEDRIDYLDRQKQAIKAEAGR